MNQSKRTNEQEQHSHNTNKAFKCKWAKISQRIKNNNISKHNKKEGDNMNCIDYPSWIMALTTIVICFITGTYTYYARQQVTETRNAIYQSQRAFVFVKNINNAQNLWDGKIKEYVIWAVIENLGNSPAINTFCKIEARILPVTDSSKPTLILDRHDEPTVLPPHTTVKSSYQVISLADMNKLWKKEKKIYVLVRVEYQDIFRPDIIQSHEQCTIVELFRNPEERSIQGQPFMEFRSCGSHDST